MNPMSGKRRNPAQPMRGTERTTDNANHRTAPEHNQHATQRCRKNLLRLRTERDTNTQLAQPLADRIRGQAEGAGDREQESKSAKEAEGDGSHLQWKETQSKLAARCPIPE